MIPSQPGQTQVEEMGARAKIEPSSTGSSTSTSSSSSADVNSKKPFSFHLPQSLQWIPRSWTWSNIKPVIRCSIVAWVSTVLFIIPKVEILMGQASFLILIAAFLSPPNDPFVGVLEREFLILLFVAVAWSWVSLGVFLANLARTNTDRTVTFIQAVSGEYIQAAPTVIMAVFVFLGSAFFLYIKARQGPGPYLFPTVFACICIDISLTTACLFPFPYYLVGRTIIIPLCFHSALALIGALVIFPSTISHQFTHRLQLFLTPLISSLDDHCKILDTDVRSDEFGSLANSITVAGDSSEGVLISLAASVRLLNNDFSWSRFAPDDFCTFQRLGRRLAGRANGMTVYFTLADPSRDPFPTTPAPSGANTPLVPGSPVVSRPPSPVRGEGRPKLRVQVEDGVVPGSEIQSTIDGGGVVKVVAPGPGESPLLDGAKTPHSTRSRRMFRSRPPSRKPSRSLERMRTGGSQTSSPIIATSPHHHHSHLHHHGHQLHHSLLHLSLGIRKGGGEHAVGVFESQRYMNLEATRLHDPYGDVYTQRATELLRDCCTDLLNATKDGLTGVRDWLGTVREDKFHFWMKTAACETRRQNRLDTVQRLRYQVASALEDFRSDKRLKVLEPYRPAFDRSTTEDNPDYVMPPHRYLFHCYVYQFHLMQFSGVVVSMLDEVIRLEGERDRMRLWTPVKRLLLWNKYDVAEAVENDEDDDPDVIQGVQPNTLEDLGMPRQRDPDALPPRNAFEWVMTVLYHAAASLAHGNVLFAIKAGLFTVLLCLPSFIKSSASFAYENRFVWAIVMGQLTLARFRGDTTFGLTARVLSTFAGGVVGMVIWYISRGNATDSPYGLAAVLGVCFPFFYFARLYWPGPPMTNIVFFVTAVLVVGYSHQDLHLIAPGSPGAGFSVAWRRFLLVTCGVAAAFIVSFLPPSTTIRRYQRRLLSTTCGELGSIYCAVVSYANTHRESEVQEIITSLIAIRSKLKRSVVLRANVIYEFSLRGRWPAQRYQKVMELQLQIAYSLAHLMSVIEHLEPAWTRALLKRTRFTDPDFQGDILAVISMIASSLRTGNPLPQITPGPLIDRFMLKYHGLDIIHKESEEDYGLPRSLTLDTLQNEQYLMFCVGVSIAFRIVNRLDRLMVAAKDIVGEQYHIHGVGMVSTARISGGVELGPRTSTVHFTPPKDV
ncbi:hypothetical protein D9756_010113 [Leucocoprinus leucothites]|uniref:ER transporter 6TM N-terminal domain-containing protein n=1 Tax=Leucocoprinus leucothites TaxID=201217 RepID=A0A8H5CRW6_9AGAR|nr:hypothetical protein D9756_010113 [Leucoagaricus leucothites]